MRRLKLVINIPLLMMILIIAMLAAANGSTESTLDANAGEVTENQVIATNKVAGDGEARTANINAWQTISAGGTAVAYSAHLVLGSTVGQSISGRGIFAIDNSWTHGFWWDFHWPCDCLPGDANYSDQVNVGDAVKIINFVFKGGDPPIPYAVCSGDANTDCFCNVGDAVFIINYVFKQGPAPGDCYDWRTACGFVIHE